MRLLTTGSPVPEKAMMSKTLLIIAWLSAFSLVDCKPTPSSDKGPEGVDSSMIGKQTGTDSSGTLATESENVKSTALVTNPTTDTKATSDTSTDTPEFQCTPKTVGPRDTITLRMAIPHGEYLVVTQPNGTTFFLVYPHREEDAGALLESSDAFAQMPMIRFGVDWKARPQLFGRDTLERIFHEAGSYVVETVHNLESERASQIHKCAVRFVPER